MEAFKSDHHVQPCFGSRRFSRCKLRQEYVLALDLQQLRLILGRTIKNGMKQTFPGIYGMLACILL
jgi:hypothetical protein